MEKILIKQQKFKQEKTKKKNFLIFQILEKPPFDRNIVKIYLFDLFALHFG